MASAPFSQIDGHAIMVPYRTTNGETADPAERLPPWSGARDKAPPLSSRGGWGA